MEGGYKMKYKRIIFISLLLLLISLLCLFALAQAFPTLPIIPPKIWILVGHHLTWDRTYGGSGNDVATSLIQTTDGGYAVAGGTYSKGAGKEDFWIIKLDEQGNLK